jgi:hypothetical protein
MAVGDSADGLISTDTGDSVALNTGIAISYFIGPAIDLIRKHPDGPKEESVTAQPILREDTPKK